MRLALVSLAVLVLMLSVARAQPAAPELPRPAKGFNEGRDRLLADIVGDPFSAGTLVERLFEQADLAELAAFCALRLDTDEKTALDTRLGLKGALARATDAAAVETALRGAGHTAPAVVTALGAVLDARHGKLSHGVAWLYGRSFNFFALQRALDGQRLDSLRLRAQLRALAASGSGIDVLASAALWEFNLSDGREEKGGHYDGVQLVEGLLALGWTEQDFAAALRREYPNGLNARQRVLIGWQDAALAWRALSRGVNESELHRAMLAYLKAQGATQTATARILAVGQARSRAVERWFRTAGPGIVGVWTGPLPRRNGEPRAPKLPPELTADADVFADSLDEPLRAHFAAAADRLTLVGYADGSARMMLERPGRDPLKYGPATPPGKPSTIQMYEGRFSVEGRLAFASLVFAGGQSAAPAELDLVNLRLVAGGALVTADLDDGAALTPVLLRRTSRLVDAP